jgi:hypothetical protein
MLPGEDDYDPSSGLPYMPRWNISSRRAQAMCVIAATPTPEEEALLERKRAREQQRKEDLQVARLAMSPVAAQIRALGRWD